MADNINEKMSSLADAIRRKSGNTEKLSIDSMTAAVSSINVEPAVKLDNVTVSAGDILSGKIAVDASGAEITGTIPTVAAVSDGKNITVPVGYIAIEQSFELGSSSGDLSDATLSPGTMLSGVVGYGASGKVVGTIETVFPALEGNVFSVPSGFVPVPQTLTVPVAGEAVIAANKVVIPAGYVAETRTVALPEMGEIIFNGNQVTVPAGFAATPLTVSLPEAEVIRHGNEMIISTGFVTQKINISLGSDISDGDVTPQTMLEGVIGYGASGRVVGSIKTVTPVMEGNTVFIPAGYLAQDQTISTGSDTATDNPPEPADIRKGKTAFANGVMITGTMPDITVTQEGNRVTVPAGFNPEAVSVTVGTAMEETVIVPGTENRIIPAGTFLSGELMVAGDSALSPLNIREGVTIFNVRGSLPVGERDVRFGYINDDLLFQELDLSGAVPEKYGSPEQTLFYIFKTGLGESGSGGNADVVAPDSGTLFEAVKVTEYTPGEPSAEIVTRVDVSGFGELSYPEEDWSEDYSYLNGSYEATPETADKTGRDRIYIHESGEVYLLPVPDDGEGEGWGFAESPDAGGYLFVQYNSALTGGVAPWYNSDLGEEMEGSLTLTVSEKEAQPMVLKGVRASGYKDGEWEFETEEITLAGFQYAPLAGGVYCLYEETLIGNYIAMESSYGADDHTLLMLSFDFLQDVTKDTSAYDHPAVISGGSSGTGFSGGGWNFDGGYLQIEPVREENEFNFGTSDFTLEAWIYPSSNERQCLWAAESDGKFAVSFSYSSNDCKIGVFGTVNNGWNNFIMSDPLPLNEWSHVAIVRSGDTLYCFVNFKKTAFSADMTGQQVDIGNSKLGIGRWGSDPYDFRAHWRGMMDDIRISNIARY